MRRRGPTFPLVTIQLIVLPFPRPLPHTRPVPGCWTGPPHLPSAPRPSAALEAGLPVSEPGVGKWGQRQESESLGASPSLSHTTIPPSSPPAVLPLSPPTALDSTCELI